MGGIPPAKERASPKPWERANPGKLQEGKVQCGWIQGMSSSRGRLAGKVQCSGPMGQANVFLTSLKDFL